MVEVSLEEHGPGGWVLFVVEPRGECELEVGELCEELSLLVQICVVANSALWCLVVDLDAVV